MSSVIVKMFRSRITNDMFAMNCYRKMLQKGILPSYLQSGSCYSRKFCVYFIRIYTNLVDTPRGSTLVGNSVRIFIGRAVTFTSRGWRNCKMRIFCQFAIERHYIVASWITIQRQHDQSSLKHKALTTKKVFYEKILSY